MRNDAAFGFDPNAFLTRVGSGKTKRQYRSKQVVFFQGDNADAVFYIQSGKVKLTVVSTRGKEAVIGVLEQGSFFGEGCLAGQPLRMSTASAMQSSSIMRVGKTNMVDLLHREPEFAELFTAYILSRNVRIEEDLVDQLFNSSEKRLARILLLLAFRQGIEAGERDPEGEPGDAGRDGRHDAVEGELLHETVQEAGLHPLQRRPAGP
jgi:CRP/FNR family transcriptional regulator, cyclic AMP receptor protein